MGWIRRLVVATLAGLLSACLVSDIVDCAAGHVCPVGLACVDPPKGCAPPEQTEECYDIGAEDGASCDYTGVPDGVCSAGVCVPAGCGNGVVESDERCDDGNTLSFDGCSADCQFDEVCGNGLVEPVIGEFCDDSTVINHTQCSSRCLPEVPTWSRLGGSYIPQSDATPSARLWDAKAYDAARGQVVMFGGAPDPFNGAAPYGLRRNDTWLWNGSLWRRGSKNEPDEGPPPRTRHAMTYDAARQQVIMFGGSRRDDMPIAAYADTWAWDGHHWNDVTPFSIGPEKREGHALTYDSKRERVVLFGGSSVGPSVPKEDTWEWNGEYWVEVTPSGDSPAARKDFGMAYDPVRGQTLVFGGYDGSSYRNDLWAWDGSEWTELAPSGELPPARNWAAMAFDAGRGTVTLVGGWDGANVLNDQWEWNGSGWIELTPDATATNRRRHSIVYDRTRKKLVLFGGADSGNSALDDGTWERDGDGGWTQVVPAGLVPPHNPPPRAFHAMARDPSRNKIVLFGGNSSVWEWDGYQWDETIPAGEGPTAELRHAMTQAPAGAGVLLFGGQSTGPILHGETWSWDGQSWTNAGAGGQGPSTRADHAMAYQLATDTVLLFGGDDGEILGDTWLWDGSEWQELSPSESPPARERHAMAYDAARDRTVLYGGDDENGERLGDLWEWDGTTWHELDPPEPKPLPLHDHAMVFDENAKLVLLHGGGSTASWHREVWSWDGTGWTGVRGSNEGPFRGRLGQTLAFDPMSNGVLLYGGWAEGGPLDAASTSFETWRFRFQDGGTFEVCRFGLDGDGDGLIGCADPDCWALCTPTCLPGSTPLWPDDCPMDEPRCGDDQCTGLESCRSCPGDCDPCDVCGDFLCEGTETPESCPGDCPVCGDDFCASSESPQTCPGDCPGCGDGVCDADESPQTCPGDCA